MKLSFLFIVFTLTFSNLSFARKVYTKDMDGESKWKVHKLDKDGKIKKTKDASDRKSKKLDKETSVEAANAN